MNSDEWRSKGELVRAGGHEIFTVRSGTGDEVLLCLHGFPTSSFDYHKVWDDLAARDPVLAFDMAGYGFSGKPKDLDYTTALQADVLESVLEQFGVGAAHIISHDYGNTIMQELLARRSERGLSFDIRSLCFMNGALFPETHRPILAQKILIGPIGPLFGRLIPDAAFKRSLASVFGTDTRPSENELREFVKIFRTNGGRRIAHRLIQYMREREIHRERWLEALRSIDFPFRFIGGLDDPVSGRHLIERFRELIPKQKDIVELENIGHFPHFEAPEAFLKHYQEFRESF